MGVFDKLKFVVLDEVRAICSPIEKWPLKKSKTAHYREKSLIAYLHKELQGVKTTPRQAIGRTAAGSVVTDSVIGEIKTNQKSTEPLGARDPLLSTSQASERLMSNQRKGLDRLPRWATSVGFALTATTALHAQIPRPDHVLIVVLENHRFDQIIGSTAAPYINSLAADSNAALFTQSFALTHPSQPNYIMLFSGSSQGVTDDNVPTGLPFATPNLGAALLAKGFSFAGYSENLPSVGFNGASSGTYVRKHNPWVNWQGASTNAVPSASNQPLTNLPSAYSQLPIVSFVIPGVTNDMHDGLDPQTITTADTWLKTVLDGYIQWAKVHNSLFILTFDEDDGTVPNHIATLVVGQMVHYGQYAEHIDHYSLLRTLEEMYSLPFAGNSLSSSPITDCWLKASILSAGPKAIAFTPTNTGGFIDTVVTISNRGNDTLRVSRIGSTSSVFVPRPPRLDIAPNTSAYDTVRFAPSIRGAAVGYIVLTSNAPSSPDSINVSGVGTNYALKTNVKRIDLGLVLVSQHKDTTITITNTGGDTLKISSINSTTPYVSARPRAFLVPPGQSFVDTMRFSPSSVGVVQSSMLISSNAPTSPDTVKVSGSGVTATTGTATPDHTPNEYALAQNYPNPFNPSTTFRYELPKEAHVSLRIFNTLGQVVATLVDDAKEAGYYQVRWNAANAPSGVYFYRLQAGQYVETKKLMVLR